MHAKWTEILNPNYDCPSSTEVQKFQQECGFPLPTDYADFLCSYNGGQVKVDHEWYAPEVGGKIFLNYLFPFSASMPNIGILQTRRLQSKNGIFFYDAISIGDDMGGGFFYLVLSEEFSGNVIFIYKDDIQLLEEDQWKLSKFRLEENIVLVSRSFSGLADVVLGGRQ